MSDKLMDRIQALINQANDVGLDSPEGKLFLGKAQELKHKHDIDDIMMRTRIDYIREQDEKRHSVTDETFDLCPFTDEFQDTYTDLAVELSILCKVRLVRTMNPKTFSTALHVIGYPNDIQYFRMLVVACRLAFSARLFPEWKVGATPGYNIRMLAESGIKWMAIWTAARNAGDPLMRRKRGGDGEMEEVPAPPNDGGFMKREMGKAYKEDGLEKPKLAHGVQNYRDSFASGFVSAIRRACDEMRMESRRREHAAGTGVDMVLASDANAVTDYFNSLYPPGSLQAGTRSRSMKAGYGAAFERGAAAGAGVSLRGSSGTVGGSGPRGEIG